MADMNTEFGESDALEYINWRNGSLTVDSQEPSTHGESSTVFFFEADGVAKVLRLSKSDAGFKKDRLAAHYFASNSVPIPSVEEVGQLDEGRYFAVSDRVPGKPLFDLPAEDLKGMFPAFLSTLESLHHSRVSGSGYGAWGANGSGTSPTWRDALEAMQHDPDDERIAALSRVDHAVIHTLREEIRGLYHFCPEERRLIHGDFNFNNVMSDKGAVTGVIDWQASQYGDPLYDYAWLDFWSGWKNPDFSGFIKKYLSDIFSDYPDFNERIRCYELIIGVESQCYYADKTDEKKFTYVSDRVNVLINETKQ